MGKIIKDALIALKYLLVSFVISFFLVIVLYLALSANEIQRFHYLYSNFVIFYYLIIKINIVIYALLPICLMITAFISFNNCSSRESSSIGSGIGLLLFCIIIFGSLYIALFEQPTRITTLSRLYQPKISKSIPFNYDKAIVTFTDYQFYFENSKAYYFQDNGLKISDITIDLKKNRLTINSLNNGIGKDFKYLDEVGSIQSLLFLKPLITKINDNFEEMVDFLNGSRSLYFLFYLFTLFFVISWIPFLIHNEDWPFPYYIISILIIIFLAILFLATFKFSIVYLKDLKLPKKYIYLFPVIFFMVIFVFESLFIYIKYSRKIFKSKIQQTKKMQNLRKGKL